MKYSEAQGKPSEFILTEMLTSRRNKKGHKKPFLYHTETILSFPTSWQQMSVDGQDKYSPVVILQLTLFRADRCISIQIATCQRASHLLHPRARL
ncbi:hypothetical protein AVEN_120946-1 [Araneus ventricosus]|uniref:Uncharacterized protein n=1 Tax=Araneus ventricosus TaxID=182803 RepID=A0A4Y2EGZ9_ARAVE|nr:hypothetical protein AVEN_120946-1 [Araneus ventricosus]